MIVVWAVASSIAAALVFVAAYTWLASQHALTTAVEALIARSDGRLVLDDARGSLTGAVTVARATWRDGGTEVVAEDVVLRFSPARLLHGTLKVDEARARRVRVVLPPADDAPIALPESIAPPLAVDVDALSIGVLDWRRGTQGGTLTDLALAYEGDARSHRLRDLHVKAEGAALSGVATLGASRPFSVDVQAGLDLAAPHPAGRIAATAKGSLDAFVVAGTSTVAGVNARGRVELAPLRPQPLVAGHVEASAVDLARFDRTWPTTQLDVVVDAKPTADGFDGTLDARNGAAGPLDRNRIPLAQAAASFALRGRVLELRNLQAHTPGRATLTGTGTIALDGWRNRWNLAVSALDLAQLHSSLRATKLDGRIAADVDGSVQRFEGDVAQDDLGLAFAARYDGTTLVAERVAARSRGGALAGSLHVRFDGARAFGAELSARDFDPSRFGAFPSGAIDGTLRADGTLSPAPVAQLDATFAEGSRLAGLPLQGRVRGRFSEAFAEGLDARLTLGATRLAASGAVNRPGQALDVTVASAQLAELAPLLPAAAPRLAGSLDARIHVEARGRGATFAVDGRSEKLRVDEWSFATLRVNAKAVHDAPLGEPRAEAIAGASVDAAATGLAGPSLRLDQAKATLAGSLAAHTLTLAATQDKRSVDVRASGALADVATAPRWQGRVHALTAEGLPALGRATLAGETDVELASDRVVVGAARIDGGGARVDVDGFAWRSGQLTTRGRFAGLAVEPIARLAGLQTRWPMDVQAKGRWDIASEPDWQGTIAIERERGDVYVDDPGAEGGARIALGLETLELEARIDGPRMALSGALRARLAGNALVEATLAAPAGRAHPFDRAAALGGTVRAHLPSLATLQPWIGTGARVQGQAIAEANLAGTLGEPGFTGQIVGYALRVDMPQYGIGLADGRLRVVSGPDGLRLEELAFTGGSGRFTASGTIALPRERGGAVGATRIAWRAENFRALNHPDRRLVVDGEGTISREERRWLLAGRVAIDEGVVAYRSRSDTELAEDIVVVGRPRAPRAQGEVPGLDAPLDIELAIEFGRDFRFSAEGLDTRLAGRLQLASRRGETFVAKGSIRAVRGTYYAFGQKLTIDRGRLVFDGPVANPSLDIVALRKGVAVEAGVEITGTVRAPVVRLTSNPPVPDNEKLSWLLTGGPPGNASQREIVALQAAQAALAGRDGRTITQRFAQDLGVDDISFVQRGTPTRGEPLAGQVVAVGKRISDRLYVAFEQGLELASNALRIEYVLSRYFTVSAYAGTTTSGLELRFRRNWQ